MSFCRKHKSRGQVTIMMVLMIGILLAGLVVFGWQRFSYMVVETQRTNDASTANLVFSGAAKKIQQIYYSDAGCDPDEFNTRLNALPVLPTTFSSGVDYIVADPSGSTADRRSNRCRGGTGCRQFGIEQAGRAYIVTIGPTTGIADDDGDTTTICPRDVTVRMHTAIRGTNFFRRVTLINICTLDSCGAAGPNGETTGEFYNSDPAVVAAAQPWYDNSGLSETSAACGNFPAGAWGDVVGTNLRVTADDLRWLRRYIRTGGGSVGDTSFANFDPVLPSNSTVNGSCSSGDNRCTARNCVPRMDLNRDGTNNDQDIAIMEYFLRGYHNRLPIIDL